MKTPPGSSCCKHSLLPQSPAGPLVFSAKPQNTSQACLPAHKPGHSRAPSNATPLLPEQGSAHQRQARIPPEQQPVEDKSRLESLGPALTRSSVAEAGKGSHSSFFASERGRAQHSGLWETRRIQCVSYQPAPAFLKADKSLGSTNPVHTKVTGTQ